MNDYDLIALDMDGTLLNSELKVTPRTERALEDALAAGKKVAFCTGRCVPEIRLILPQLPKIRYAICANGAYIYDFQDERKIHEDTIPPQEIMHILDVLKNERVMRHVFRDCKAYFAMKDYSRLEEFHVADYRKTFEYSAICDETMFDNYAVQPFAIEKFNAYFATKEDRSRVREILSDRPIHLVESLRCILEINTPTATKANALKKLGSVLNVNPKRIIFVGDGGNDIEAIRFAGLGVAMGNADEDVKTAADVVTDDCDHDGVASVIERYLLK